MNRKMILSIISLLMLLPVCSSAGHDHAGSGAERDPSRKPTAYHLHR